MNKYWVSQGSPNKDFWAHEVFILHFISRPVDNETNAFLNLQFSKHATCTSTFDIACYENYEENEDVVNFFDTTIRAFQMFPTFDILAA